MIAYLKGTILEKGANSLILDVQGVGYELFVAPGALLRLGGPGETAELHVSESTPLYGGGTALYGFPAREEKDVFLCLREHVPSTGAKKALEHLEKASRSLPDFRRAILEGDARILAGVFGFTTKTAERLINSLKDKLASDHRPAGPGEPAAAVKPSQARALQQALDALLSLGYKPAESRQALQSISSESAGREMPVEEIVRLALKRI